jgi:DNA-3-methyladenine glycosylase I
MDRCGWATNDRLIEYHDAEWGVPVHDDRKLYEFIVLDGMQAGLSWDLVLRRREGYRVAFDNFDPQKVARYTPRRIERLMQDERIIRNRLKIEMAIRNARAALEVQEEFDSFNAYIWRFVDGRTIVNTWRTMAEVPSRTSVSDAMSKDLRNRGFTFVGSTICYAFMQAAGLVNDHLVSCFRYREVGRPQPRGQQLGPA